jgi:TfoX/Sxy family transcriptional regulator of competence genes
MERRPWQPARMTTERWLELVEGAVGGPVTEGTMFGAKGLRTGRKFFAIWWHERLVAKLPAQRLAALVADGQAEQFEPMDGRPMNGWVLLSESVHASPLVDEARAFVESQTG